MDSPSLHKLIDQLPDDLQVQVYDVAHFLLEKQVQSIPKKPRVAGLHAGQMIVSEDVDSFFNVEANESGI